MWFWWEIMSVNNYCFSLKDHTPCYFFLYHESLLSFLLNARDMRKVIYFRKKVLLKGIHHLVCVSDINFRVPQLFNFHIGAHAARELVLRSVIGNNSIKLQYDNCKEMSDNLHSFIIIPQIKELYPNKIKCKFIYVSDLQWASALIFFDGRVSWWISPFSRCAHHGIFFHFHLFH